MIASAPQGLSPHRKRALTRSLLAALLLSCLLVPGSIGAQDAVEVSFQGLAGISTVAPGGEILIYAVELQDINPGNPTARVGGVPLGSEGIALTIDDLVGAPTGLVVGDFNGLNIYRSADGVLDGGDTFLKTITPVTIAGITLITFTGVGGPLRIIDDTPGSVFFLVTAVIGAATVGHAFTLAFAGLHIDIRDTGGGMPNNYNLGTGQAANDANHVLITASGGGGSSGGATGTGASSGGAAPAEPIGVPFSSHGLLAILIVGYGVYRLHS